MLICACRTSENVFPDDRQLVRTSALCVRGNIHSRHVFLCLYDLNWLCHLLTWAPLITFLPSRAVFNPRLGFWTQHSRGQWAFEPNTPTYSIMQTLKFDFLFTFSFSSFSSGWYYFNDLGMQNKKLDVKCVVSSGETKILRMGRGKNNSKYKN